MNKKSFIFAEIAGFFAAIAGVIFLWNVYELTNHSTLSVVFGAVNSSVWEKAKGLSISYLLLGLTELLGVRPLFRRFVTAKAAGLGVALSVFLFADSFFGGELCSDLVVLSIALLCGFSCSCFLTLSKLGICPFFAPACFLLLLIFLMTFTFTAFAPKLELFRDPYTGYYGVLPISFDYGAVNLGS